MFGKPDAFASSFHLVWLNGTNGFRLEGAELGGQSGYSVSGAGDVNGDGFDDLIVGARFAPAPNPYGNVALGETYVVFGKSDGFSSTLALSTLDGTTGFQLDGTGAFDRSGNSVSGAGDVNGDGFDDLIIGAPGADNGEIQSAGESYVVFGGNFTGGVETQIGTAFADTLSADRGETAADLLIGGLGNDTLIGDGGADVLRGGAGNDTLSIPDSDFSGTRRLVGGNGNDTVRLAGSAVTFDLTAIHDNRIMDVEEIDIRGSGNNSLTLDFQEVINISSSSNKLVVRQDSGDTINIGDGWSRTSRLTIESVVYELFTQGVAELLIEDATPKVAETFSLPNGGGEYLISVNTTGLDLEVLQTLPSAATILTVPLNQLGDLTISGSANADTVTLGDLDGYGRTIIFNGNGGDDLFDASAASQTTRVRGGSGNDTFLGGSGADRFDGGSGADSGTGGAGNDSLLGNGGDDTLAGDVGDDFVNGNAGRDALSGNDGNDTVFGGSGTDTLDGGSGDDFVKGQGGQADIVAGGGGDDTLRGSGRDVIVPGSADTVPATPTQPGEGSALNVALPLAGGPYTVLVDGSRLKVTSPGETLVDVSRTGVSDVSIVGSAGDDSVTLDASLATLIGSVTFKGGAGNDSFDSSTVSILTLFVGGVGNDTLAGGDGRDQFNGGDGDDSAHGGAGNDILKGDSGDDILVGDAGDDVLNGSKGMDSLFGGEGDDTLLGGGDTDLLDGGNGSDVVNGQGGTGDIVAGGGGATDALRGDSSDRLIDGPSGSLPGSTGVGGGAVLNGVLTVALPADGGSFSILVEAGQILVVPASGGLPLVDGVFAVVTDIVVNGGAGDDVVVLDATLAAIGGRIEFNGSGGNDSLDSSSYTANVVFNGGEGDDTLIGGSGNDVANGGAGNDSIFTGAGTDLIHAGIGDDFVDAGSDDDTVFGEDGDDVLIGGSGNDFLNGNGGSDTITGEDGNDTLLGGSHRDSLDGGLGDDLVRGQGGGGDKAVAGDGVDVVVP